MQWLRGHIGQSEDRVKTELNPNGQNTGAIVEKMARQLVSAAFWDSVYPKGAMLWCAAAGSTAYLEACQDAGNVEAENTWRRVLSVDCDTLYKRCKAKGWIRSLETLRDAPIGAILFFGTEADVSHVELVERIEGTEEVTVYTVGGNIGNAVGKARYDAASGRQIGSGSRRIVAYAVPVL